ncbi:MAG: hypothetical protein IT489_09485 [Gammaproteobacteria bacterium]|nr:hypothetical protein [Gammaproteobacteria bacterium]
MFLRAASTEEELTKCRRLWYDVYVSEMGRHIDEADHDRKTLSDERDLNGRLLYLSNSDGDVLGTVLVTLSRSISLGYYEDLYQMKNNKDARNFLHPYRTSICTKLILRKDTRGSSAVLRLSGAAYAYGLLHGIRFNFIDCRKFMLRTFQRMGYHIHNPKICHPKYGEAICMVLDLEDNLHLAEMGSHFLRILDYWQGKTEGDFSEEETLLNQLMRC